MRIRTWGLAALLACMGVGAAHAQGPQANVEARLVETFPAGNPVEVAPGERVRVRVAYRTGTPLHIYVTPYYRGERVRVANCGAPEVSGDGEFLTCFELGSGDVVDELRVSAGNGNPHRTPEIARWPLRALARAGAPLPGPAPEWVARLEAEQDAAVQARMSGPPTAGDMAAGLVVAALAWAALAIGVAGLVWPLWAVRRWRGGWRVLAAIPAAAVGMVVLNLLVGVLLDPTSHNLWPFELLMVGGFAGLAMLALVLVRWWKARAAG